MVFTSGIVDEGPVLGLVVPQYYPCSFGWPGVEPGVAGVGVGVGTLLGPEGSGPPFFLAAGFPVVAG